MSPVLRRARTLGALRELAVEISFAWPRFTFGRLTFGAKREHPLTVVELAVVSAGERAA